MTDDATEGDDIEALLELWDQIDTATLDIGTAVPALDPDDPGVGVDGPDEETRYWLERSRLPRAEFQAAARRVTAAVLAVTPRSPATVRLLGIEPLLRDRDTAAVETLTDAGVAADGDSLCGECPATEPVVEATLQLYVDGLVHAHTLDVDGNAITARYDGYQHQYWLPADTTGRLRRRLDPPLADAVVRFDE